MKQWQKWTIIPLSLTIFSSVQTLAAKPVASDTERPVTTTPNPTAAADKPSFNARTGELRIPCVSVEGLRAQGKEIPAASYNVVMKQRGASNNWEVTFVAEGCSAEELPPAEQPVDEAGPPTGSQ